MKNAIIIFFDDKYFLFARSCVKSISINYPSHPEIILFYDGFRNDASKSFEEEVTFHCISFEDEFRKNLDFNVSDFHLGKVNNPKIYFKYFLWTDYFKEYNNLLLLDADTVVLRPLDTLFECSDFFAVSDNTTSEDYRLFYPNRYDDPALLKKLEADNLKLPANRHDMINAGVLLVPKRYRNEHYKNELIQMTNNYNEYLMFGDQSAISLWCMKNKIIPSREFVFNYQPCFLFDLETKAYEINEIFIIHFTWWKPKDEFYSLYKRGSEAFLKLDDLLQKFFF